MLRASSTARAFTLVSMHLLLATALHAQLWQARDQAFIHDDGVDYEDAQFGFALAGGDWNGDGFSDLMVGEPNYQDLGGATHQFRGTALGLDSSSSTFGVQEQRRGYALAIGDFNADGFDDVAYGEPFYVEDGIEEGRVGLFRGSSSGLAFDQSFLQSLPDVPGAPENGDEFGAALAAGDFNGDGYDDLAVGAPGEDVGDVADAGSVTILYGSADGLTAVGSQIWHLDSTSVPESPGAGDRLGAALAAYRPNCDAYSELAIGAPGRTVGGFAGAGAVLLLTGSATGVGLPAGVLDESDAPISGDPRAGEAFGAALADADNLDGSPCGALLIGAPGERVGVVSNAGAVWYYFATTVRYTQEDFGYVSESGDRFGAALAPADFDDDGNFDLAIGAPGEAFTFGTRTGAVHVLFSYGGDPDPTRGQFLFARGGLESSEWIESAGEFGAALAAGDWNGDGTTDLAIGAPGAQVEGDVARGAVQIVYGALYAADFEDGAFGEWESHTPE
jgi:hypothetical protein